MPDRAENDCASAQLIKIVNVDLGQPLVVLFFENTDGAPYHFRHLAVVFDKIERPPASLIGIFTLSLDADDFYGEIFPVSSLDQ